MSKIKFESELDDSQFEKFTDFLTWLKNDKNYKSGVDIINKNNEIEDIYLIAVENYIGDRQEITKLNQYQLILY